MKARNIGNYIIALTVILCSVVLFGALVFAITGVRLQSPDRTLQIDFQDVAGIDVGSPVRYAGQPAGEVIEIRPLSAQERRESGDPSFVLRVTVQISEGLPEFGQDMRAGIASDSFIGQRFLALIPGSASAEPLRAGEVIRATESSLIGSIQRVGRRLEGLLQNLEEDYPRLSGKAAGLMDRADGLTQQGSRLVESLEAALTNLTALAVEVHSDYSAVYGPQLQDLLSQLQGVNTHLSDAILTLSTNANRTLRQAGNVLEDNRSDVNKVIAELKVVAQNLKVISTYAKGLTGQLAQKPSRLLWGGNQDPLPSEQQILDSPEPVEIPLQKKNAEK